MNLYCRLIVNVLWRWFFKISMELIQVKILKKRLTPRAVHEVLFSRLLRQIQHILRIFSLIKQPTFRDPTTGFPAKWRLRNEGTNFILMTFHCRGQSGASDWLCRERNLLQPIRSTTQIWVVTRHQYGILGLLLGRHFAGTPEEESWKAGSFVRCANLTKQPASQVSRDANRLSSDANHIWIFTALNPALDRLLI